MECNPLAPATIPPTGLRASFIEDILEASAKTNHVLLAGCGGGYDIYSALPLLHALENAGRTVVLANLTFTFSFNGPSVKSLPGVECVVAGALWRVKSDPPTNASEKQQQLYFPEM
jgi:hypothetical protein